MKRHGVIKQSEVIFSHKEYELLCYNTSKEWMNLKLISSKRRKKRSDKRNWWLAWNGVRLSGNRDAKLLNEYLPDVYLMVVNKLSKGCNQ